MKKTLIPVIVFSIYFSSVASAQPVSDTVANSETTSVIENTETDTITKIQYRGIIPKEGEEGASEAQDTFAKKVKEGTLSLGDVPLVIVYWLDWLTWLAGSIAVLFVVIGGYQYSIGGITDDKERGKKTLLYAIAGLIVTFFAWIAVDILQTWLTAMA